MLWFALAWLHFKNKVFVFPQTRIQKAYGGLPNAFWYSLFSPLRCEDYRDGCDFVRLRIRSRCRLCTGC